MLLRLSFLIGDQGHNDIADEISFESITDIFPKREQLSELLLDPESFVLSSFNYQHTYYFNGWLSAV